MKSPSIIASTSLLLFTPFSHAVSLALTPSQDNVIYNDPTVSLSNALGANLFAGVNGGGGGNIELRTLITFDVSAIPSGSTINNVTLQLLANSPRGTSTTVTTNLHRLLGDWGEGTSVPNDGGGGSGGDATAGDATWTHQFWTTDLWNNAGGDFVPSPSATLDITDNLLYSWTSPTLTSDVQGFIDGSFDNYGWILIAEEDARTKRFFSGNNAAIDLQPQLIIDYTLIPEPGTISLLATLLIPTLLKRRRI